MSQTSAVALVLNSSRLLTRRPLPTTSQIMTARNEMLRHLGSAHWQAVASGAAQKRHFWSRFGDRCRRTTSNRRDKATAVDCLRRRSVVSCRRSLAAMARLVCRCCQLTLRLVARGLLYQEIVVSGAHFTKVVKSS